MTVIIIKLPFLAAEPVWAKRHGAPSLTVPPLLPVVPHKRPPRGPLAQQLPGGTHSAARGGRGSGGRDGAAGGWGRGSRHCSPPPCILSSCTPSSGWQPAPPPLPSGLRGGARSAAPLGPSCRRGVASGGPEAAPPSAAGRGRGGGGGFSRDGLGGPGRPGTGAGPGLVGEGPGPGRASVPRAVELPARGGAYAGALGRRCQGGKGIKTKWKKRNKKS